MQCRSLTHAVLPRVRVGAVQDTADKHLRRSLATWIPSICYCISELYFPIDDIYMYMILLFLLGIGPQDKSKVLDINLDLLVVWCLHPCETDSFVESF